MKNSSIRKKLNGQECFNCKEFYDDKLKEGFSANEVQEMKNKFSKHRSKFPRTKTPERFWDPSIIQITGDPREYTQPGALAGPLRLKKETKEKDRKDKINGIDPMF